MPAEELAGQKLIESWSKRSKEQVTGYPLKYLNKIIKYCRDNDIDLIAVTSPITPSSVGTLHMENVHDTINKLLADNGVFYYDFNMARQDILPRQDLREFQVCVDIVTEWVEMNL